MFVSLQVGRGLAAAAVAAVHLSLALGDPAFGGDGNKPFWSLVERGYLGVDFFFVLSGFIILQAHHRDVVRPDRIAPYLARRIIRIYPIYWIYLTACILGMVIVGSSHLELTTPLEVISTYSLVRIATNAVPLAQAWTLFHEIVFYFIFAALLVGRRVGIAVIALWTTAIAASCVYASPYATPRDLTFATSVLGAYNLNFMVGMCAFLGVSRLSVSRARWCIAGGTLLLAFFYHVEAIPDTPEILRFGYALAFALVMSGAVALEKLGGLTFPSWAGFLGDASYSIYLLHEHVENYAIRALLKLGWWGAGRGSAEWAFMVVFIATIAIGCAAYVLLERPLLRQLRARIERARPHS